MKDSKKMKLVVLGDNPMMQSGFARVLQNLIPNWLPFCDGPINIFAIGYTGNPYHKQMKEWLGWDGQGDPPINLWPAATYSDPVWWDDNNLRRFLTLVDNLAPTHIFMMHDPWAFIKISKNLEQIQDEHGTEIHFYCPIDCPRPRPEWIAPLRAVDFPTAYTEFGKQALIDAAAVGNGNTKMARRLKDKISVIPHGCDTEMYHPIEPDEIKEIKKLLLHENGKSVIGEDDILISSVNMHQKRKDVPATLSIFKELLDIFPEPERLHLYMHMAPVNGGEGTELGVMLEQLGIKGKVHLSAAPEGPRLPEEGLNQLYNASDLILSTTLGEGWGFTITEALAAGTPVAAPGHTTIPFLLDNGRNGLILPCADEVFLLNDNSVMRNRVEIKPAARRISDLLESPKKMKAMGENGRKFMLREDFKWDHISRQWLDQMGMPKLEEVAKLESEVEKQETKTEEE